MVATLPKKARTTVCRVTSIVIHEDGGIPAHALCIGDCQYHQRKSSGNPAANQNWFRSFSLSTLIRVKKSTMVSHDTFHRQLFTFSVPTPRPALAARLPAPSCDAFQSSCCKTPTTSEYPPVQFPTHGQCLSHHNCVQIGYASP